MASPLFLGCWDSGKLRNGESTKAGPSPTSSLASSRPLNPSDASKVFSTASSPTDDGNDTAAVATATLIEGFDWNQAPKTTSPTLTVETGNEVEEPKEEDEVHHKMVEGTAIPIVSRELRLCFVDPARPLEWFREI